MSKTWFFFSYPRFIIVLVLKLGFRYCASKEPSPSVLQRDEPEYIGPQVVRVGRQRPTREDNAIYLPRTPFISSFFRSGRDTRENENGFRRSGSIDGPIEQD